MLYFAAMSAALICSMIVPPANAQCDDESSAPETSLSDLHFGCYTDTLSRHPDCVAAMHRYCDSVTFSTDDVDPAGISREHANDVIDLACIDSQWSGTVEVSVLYQLHNGCTRDKSQHRDCLAAIHRYCQNLLGSSYAGVSQEVGEDHFQVHCFEATHKESVDFDVLHTLHEYCVYPDSDSAQCFAAANRFCQQYYSASGGITQEVANDQMYVACYDAAYSGNAYTIKNNDYYEARSQAIEVCSLDFDIPQGEILETNPEVLLMGTYDNSNSDTTLQAKFVVSESVTETSRFEHSHSITISVSATFSTGLPLVSSGEITLSSSVTSGVSFSEETSVTTTYSHTSEVDVPPYTRLIMEAAITRAELSVPWTARVRNGIGTLTTISGTWYGVTTYDLKITQYNY